MYVYIYIYTQTEPEKERKIENKIIKSEEFIVEENQR